jgi:hypothetical protein
MTTTELEKMIRGIDQDITAIMTHNKSGKACILNPSSEAAKLAHTREVLRIELRKIRGY